MPRFSNKKLIVLIIILIAPLSIFEQKILDFINPHHDYEKISVNGQVFNLEFADTPAKWERGLSGRTSLAKNAGLFFVFNKSDYHGFWMKEMKFPIDIVWFDDEKKPVGITRNLTPESYPKIFYPPQKVRYVLEVNTGIIP